MTLFVTVLPPAPRLQRLELGFCGRGFGDDAAVLLAAVGPLGQLEVAVLEGAYRLSDAGVEQVNA
jgi:hypothetical protein